MPPPKSARLASCPDRRPRDDHNDRSGARPGIHCLRDATLFEGITETGWGNLAANVGYPPWAGRGIVKTRRPLRNTGTPVR